MSAVQRCEGCSWELPDFKTVPWTPRQRQAAEAKRCPSCGGRMFALVVAPENEAPAPAVDTDQLGLWAGIGEPA
jgi:DNA-directed RNA polymerase subunit RPC12/RpoP